MLIESRVSGSGCDVCGVDGRVIYMHGAVVPSCIANLPPTLTCFFSLALSPEKPVFVVLLLEVPHFYTGVYTEQEGPWAAIGSPSQDTSPEKWCTKVVEFCANYTK